MESHTSTRTGLRICSSIRPSVRATAFCLPFAILLFAAQFAQAGDAIAWNEVEQSILRNRDQFLQQARNDLASAKTSGNREKLLVALRMLVMAKDGVGRKESMQDDVNEGLALARSLADAEALCFFLEHSAVLAQLNAKRDEANAFLDEALEIARRHQLDAYLALLYYDKGRFIQQMSRHNEALEWYMKAYGRLDSIGSDQVRIKLLNAIADIYNVRGTDYHGGNPEDVNKAIDFYRQALALSERTGNAHQAAIINRNLGESYLAQRNFPEARKVLERALALNTEQHSPNAHIDKLFLGHLALEEKRFAAALAYYDDAMSVVSKSADAQRLRFYAQIGRAQALSETNHKADAMKALDTALPLAMTTLDRSYFHTRAHALYARLGEFRLAYETLGKQHEAETKMYQEQDLKALDELKVRFDVRLKDADNARLIAQQQETDAKRLAMMLALALIVVLAGGVAYYLRRRAVAAETRSRHHAALAEAETAANRAKSAFLANMSHELRSPLNAMLGFTRLLTRDPKLPEEARSDLGIVLSSGEHLYALINQVLDLSKIEAGRAVLTEQDFELDDMLDDLADTFSLMARQKGLLLRIDSAPDVPQRMNADAVKLRQVLTNLLSNAIKFTREGSVSLHVATAPAASADELRLSFNVSDTGAGMTQEELGELGKPFVQTQAGRAASEGTGLGIAISRNFVALMGGKLAFVSEPGIGTTISFAIAVKPAHPADPADMGVHASHKERGGRVIGMVSGERTLRILAVDDRAEGRHLLSRLLAPIGFEIIEACNGREALELWESRKPDLILMDMRMPVMDGREATRRIRAAEPERTTVIIALTASSYSDERDAILADGCNEFMRKPFREEDLLELIRRYLGVTYLHADGEMPSKQTAASSIPAAKEGAASLPSLPEALRAPLVAALDQLDADAIEAAIDAIAGYDGEAAVHLAALAERFDYARMRAELDMQLQ
jgi:signal transduction histidine kinase/DNA-binding NarL/FixJ family response regulator